MTTDLVMLTASAVFCALLFVPSAVATTIVWGLPVAAGNRASTPPVPPWVDRSMRAHRNMLENLPHFAVLVLVAHVTGLNNLTTALGATIFFWARIAHAAVYTAGIPWVRTLAFSVGLVGEAMILVQLF